MHDTVAQYNLIESAARNRKPTMVMKIGRVFRCKDYVNQHWYLGHCPSSRSITELILRDLRAGWRDDIRDAATYRIFNDRSMGQSTLRREGCYQDAGMERETAIRRERPHLAHGHGSLSFHPDMLMTSTRQNLFTTACDELRLIFKDQDDLPLNERKLVLTILDEVRSTEPAQQDFVGEACKIAEVIFGMDADKRWKVVSGRGWRCYATLQADAGDTCTPRVWAPAGSTSPLSGSYYPRWGMERFAERLQKPELPREEETTPARAASASPAPTRVVGEDDISPV